MRIKPSDTHTEKQLLTNNFALDPTVKWIIPESQLSDSDWQTAVGFLSAFIYCFWCCYNVSLNSAHNWIYWRDLDPFEMKYLKMRSSTDLK